MSKHDLSLWVFDTCVMGIFAVGVAMLVEVLYAIL